MATSDIAKELARSGFYVFPLRPNGKTPAITGWQEAATRDEKQIAAWWSADPDRNIGISTSKYGDGRALVVVDVDTKNGKRGNQTLAELDMLGCDFPITMEQRTPSGGHHLIYICDKPLRQGTDVLGEGVDIRSKGGLFVGPGSQIDGAGYVLTRRILPVAAPAWLVDRLGVAADRPAASAVALDGVDPDRAAGRAIEYLKTAPVAIEGQGGDLTTYKVAAKLKDYGLTQGQAHELMCEHWNERCEPRWPTPELFSKIAHAYRYGREPAGVAAPEAVFEKAEPSDEDDGEHPADSLNREFAFIKRGAFVLQETTDEDGNPATLHLTPNDMHAWFANKTMSVQTAQGNKAIPLSKLWMTRPSRREYDAVVFSPQKDLGPRWYNLWRGFAVEPAETGDHPSVAAFLEHALDNVCRGDKALCHWLIGFFAHLVQKPHEKPPVALVFKGRKGVGKNALVERVGALLGQHFMVADDDRYLLGNFNSHLENNLFFVLDEASWAGDKRAEGRLKGLITGERHTIERKGFESYRVRNLTRVAIIGNEDWIVPASQDERRFAVFNVGEGRRQDRKFFIDMRVGMEKGGYSNLLRFLLDYDISDLDLGDAPQTEGLVQQKHASLGPVEEWWLDCLRSNELHGSGFEGDLPPHIPKNRIHEAFKRWADTRNIRSRLPSRNAIYDTVKRLAPSFKHAKRRPEEAHDATYAYINPGIAVLRADWEKYIGGKVDWE